MRMSELQAVGGEQQQPRGTDAGCGVDGGSASSSMRVDDKDWLVGEWSLIVTRSYQVQTISKRTRLCRRHNCVAFERVVRHKMFLKPILLP